MQILNVYLYNLMDNKKRLTDVNYFTYKTTNKKTRELFVDISKI